MRSCSIASSVYGHHVDTMDCYDKKFRTICAANQIAALQRSFAIVNHCSNIWNRIVLCNCASAGLRRCGQGPLPFERLRLGPSPVHSRTGRARPHLSEVTGSVRLVLAAREPAAEWKDVFVALAARLSRCPDTYLLRRKLRVKEKAPTLCAKSPQRMGHRADRIPHWCKQREGYATRPNVQFTYRLQLLPRRR